MPKEIPEAVAATGPDASAEPSSMSPKKMALILLAAIVVGLFVGVGGAMALRKMSPPPAAPATGPGSVAPEAPGLKATGVEPVVAPAAAASPAASAPSLEPSAPGTASAPARAAGEMLIPGLTGMEIKERYNISRFVDVETDQLCYLAEPRASGMNGSLTCGPRSSHVPTHRSQ